MANYPDEYAKAIAANAELANINADLAIDNINLAAKAEMLEDALEHCGYDPTDCIDCGGPPHNEWCRFWKLRDIVPMLFDAAEEDLDKLTTQQKPTEEAMEEA